VRKPRARTILACLLLPLCAGALADEHKPKKPQTRLTQTLGQATYKQMELAQKAFEARDYRGAEADLDALKARSDKLNDFEKATLWNLYAAVFRSEDDNRRAVEAYAQVLRQDNLPEGLRDNALFSLAQTLFLLEEYRKSIAVMNRWLAVVQEVQPDAYVLLAQACYQLHDYPGAKAPLLKALSIARQRQQPWKESWLGLLRAVLYEMQDYAGATRVMQVLVEQYPKGVYFEQLSGLYGVQNQQAQQLKTLYVAYLGGYLGSEADLLNLARLCMAQNVPERGVDVLKAGFAGKLLQPSIDNLQLLAQAQSMARDTGQSIPVLQRLAQMSGLSRHYVYLGQAYAEQGDWPHAVDAFNSALAGKEPGDPAVLRMQLATALFNDGKLRQARDTFAQAAASPAQQAAAGNWIRFIDGQLRSARAAQKAPAPGTT